MYDMIFKRKSFHLFKNTGDKKISIEELNKIKNELKKLVPLNENIKIDIKIVRASETSCNKEEEYCILFYSEKKDNYLQNIGYIGEQLDLYLVSLNIGTLWYGIGKEENYNDLDFVIMMAIKKVDADKFRKDMFKSKRKNISEIWKNEYYKNVAEIVRFAPSACNLQPWFVESYLNELKVYRIRPNKRGIMPTIKVDYYNKIDIGIFLLFLELCLKENNVEYERQLLTDDDSDKAINAIYKVGV